MVVDVVVFAIVELFHPTAQVFLFVARKLQSLVHFVDDLGFDKFSLSSLSLLPNKK